MNGKFVYICDPDQCAPHSEYSPNLTHQECNQLCDASDYFSNYLTEYGDFLVPNALKNVANGLEKHLNDPVLMEKFTEFYTLGFALWIFWS